MLSALLVLLLVAILLLTVTGGPAARVRRIAGGTPYGACALTAYMTARYDAETLAQLLQLDTDNKAVGVLTAMSRLNTLSPREALSTCSRYRKLLGKLINADSLTATQTTVMPASGGAARECTLYTFEPTKAQMVAFITTLAKNMETDGGLFVLSRAFYTALMMVAQDATEVMAIHAFENAWKSLSGADAAHVEATAERLLKNNFPITIAAKGNRVYALHADFVFEESSVQLAYASDGILFGGRHDKLSLLVDDTNMEIGNTVSLSLPGGVSGELVTNDGDQTSVTAYGKKDSGAGGTLQQG